MTSIARQELSIHIDVMDALNKQIQKEAQASANYLAMASWCDQQGMEHCAAFFYSQSAEERNHMMKIFSFINNNGGAAISPEVQTVNHDFESITEIFQQALQQEIDVTKAVNHIVAKSRDVKDFITDNFMQWFVNEQMEEEQTMRKALDIFRLGNGLSLLELDERIATLKKA